MVHQKILTYLIKLNLKFTIALCLMLSPLNFASSKIRDFETTRLKSTAGTGVGSILINEATILNPAPLGFYNLSAIYIQKINLESNPTSNNPKLDPHKSAQMGFIASDAKGRVKGSVSYLKQREALNERKRLSVATATRVGKKSALGLAFRHTTDFINENGEEPYKTKYKQFIVGITHSVTSEFTLGLVLVDPLRAKKIDNKALFGFQYVYDNFVIFMLDTGADYNQSLSNTLLYRAALQVSILSDFFLRFGTFNDKGTVERGNGIGLSWIQPKLALEVALKNTKVSESKKLRQAGEEIKEVAFSLSYRF